MDDVNNDGEQVPDAWSVTPPEVPNTPPQFNAPPAQAQPPLTPPPVTPPASPVTPPPVTPPPVTPQLGQAIGAAPAMPPGAGEATVVSSTPPGGPTPAGEPVLSGEYGISAPPVAPDVPKTSSKLPWIAAVIGALVLLGGGGFFALNAFGASGGADTPDEAVDEMLAALNNEDFISLGELIEPSERRTFVEPTITELLPELSRLGLLSDDVDAGDVGGVDWEFTDVTYRVDPIADNPDMVHVYFTGGELATEVNVDEFPFSDRFREEFGDELEDEPRTVEPIESSETPVTFVQRDGKWYFSMWFSLAEAIRLDEGERLPLASEAPAALGSESPEAAVEAMFAEIVELDMAGMIGRMDPDEMAVLYRYSPLFIQDAQLALDDANQFLADEQVTWNISDFDFDVDTDGDDAIVTIRGFTLDVTSPDVNVSFTYGREQLSGRLDADELGGRGAFEATTTRIAINGVVDGTPFDFEITIDPDEQRFAFTGSAEGESVEGEVALDESGICSRYSITAEGETETGCLEDEFDENIGGDDMDPGALLDFYEGFLDDWPEEFPGVSMTARRTEGEWYVSPIGTGYNNYLEVLRQFDDDQLNELLDSGFDGANAFEDVVDEAMNVTEGVNDMVDDEVVGIDDFGGAAELETTIAMAVDRGAVAELADSISTGAYDSVEIDLEAGDTITVTVETSEASSLDTTLTLLYDGQVVDFNDDAPGLASSLDSQLEASVDQTGSYEIQVSSFDGGSSGEYSLSVARN